MVARSPKKVVKRNVPGRGLTRFGNVLRKRLRILLFSLVLVIGVLILLVGVYLFQALREGLILAASGVTGQSREVNTENNFNLLFFEIAKFEEETSLVRQMKLLNFQVAENKLNILDVPVDQPAIDFSGGALTKIASVYGLANLSGRATAQDVHESEPKFSLQKNLVLNLGLPIDGYLYTDEAGFLEIQEKLSLGEDSFGGFLGFFSVIKSLPLLGRVVRTNLTLRSTLGLAVYAAFNFPTEVENYSAQNLVSDPDRFDHLARSRLADPQVEAERLKIIVLNGTKRAGLASSVGRAASNLGLTVLSVDNAPEGQIYQDSLLITKSQNYFSVLRLAEVFGISDIRAAESLAANSNFARLLRADLVLIAGNDQLFDQ